MSLRNLEKSLILLVVLSVVLNALGLWWGLPPDEYFAWDVDGIAPLQPLVAAKHMFIDDWWNSGYYNKYPLGHFFVLMAAYAPYIGYLWLTGGLNDPSEVYPFGLSDPDTALTVLALIARGISALMGVGIVVLVYLTARRFVGRRAALFSGLTVALSPAFIYYAHTGNVDTPSLFWCALGLFAFGRLVAAQCELRNYLLLGGAAAMAAATKEQTIGLFLFLPLSVLVLHTQHAYARLPRHRAIVRAATDPKLLGGLAASIVTFVVATHLIFNWDGNMLRLRWRLSGIHPIYGMEYPGGVGGVPEPAEALVSLATHTWDAMNPVLFLVGLAGVVMLPLRARWARHFAVPLISYAVFAVALFSFYRARFVMEAVLALAFFAGPLLAGLWTLGVKRSRVLVIGVALIWLYSLAYGAEVDYLMLRDSRYAAEAWFETHARPGATVEAYSHPVYLPRFPRHVNVRYADLTSTELAGLNERAPDFLVFSSAYSRRFQPGSEEAAYLHRLLDGDFGYRPVGTFETAPVVTPRLIPTLSPEIVVLANGR
jgi:4-amino-4-deoxy-L-arabinose transferase-like glycosyltransferase